MYAYDPSASPSFANTKPRSTVASVRRTELAEVKEKCCARHAPSLSPSVRSMGVRSLAVHLRPCFRSTYDRGTS